MKGKAYDALLRLIEGLSRGFCLYGRENSGRERKGNTRKGRERKGKGQGFVFMVGKRKEGT